MARAAVRESMTVAGRAEWARVARAFTAGMLGPGHPCGTAAAVLVSELFSDSIRHSGSDAEGQTVTIAVRAAGSVVRVEVTDRGGRGVPQLRACGGEAEGGRGLEVVAGLAARWGWRRRGGRMVTWFELRPGSHAQELAARLRRRGPGEGPARYMPGLRRAHRGRDPERAAG